MKRPPTTSRSKAGVGPRALYRPKLRERTLTFALTADGHAALAARLAATGLSRSDYLESLIRADLTRQMQKETRNNG